MKFMIFSPPYQDDNGGAIALHYLCHLLNEKGYQAVIVPLFRTYESNQRFIFRGMRKSLSSKFQSFRRHFHTSPELKTPVIRKPPHPLPDDTVVIYPEIVDGNPLGAKNVVRWLLHRPGYLTGKVSYGTGELYFDYNAFSDEFGIPGSNLSKKKIFIAKYHDHLYNQLGALPPELRTGSAHCIRKGKEKKFIHSPDSILIDGLSHHEISKIFKRVKKFISYDTKTMYSTLAAVCGAESIVIPDEGVSKEQWEPNPVRSYGIAYGFDDLENARQTVPLVARQLEMLSETSKQAVDDLIIEVMDHFKL